MAARDDYDAILLKAPVDRQRETFAVSGFYLAHPQALYLDGDRIGQDQLSDLCAPHGLEEPLPRRLLAHVVG